MNYFISPPSKTDLKIDPTQLAANLKSQWQNVKIKQIKNPHIAFLASVRYI
ncbi:MAG: hypothetical protein F6K21_19190 [Symploca sp. SIO2D2]|nr:hypothetical protein [Symploca sp. SIO2D2]